MALDNLTLANKSGKAGNDRQIFTFFIEDMMFGVNVENVLMLGQEVNEIQRLPVEERGFCGVVKLQGSLVPVLDYAHRIEIPSGIDTKTALLETLTTREQDHVEWLNSLEQSIKTGIEFTKALNPDQCAFGKWYNKFDTRDETLRDLMAMFDEPHRKIHGLGEVLLNLRDNGKSDEALEILKHEKATTLRRLRALFGRARDQIKSGMRPVLLYITTDGKTPRYALLIDEINDVINYSANDFQASSSGGMALFNKIEHVLDGIFTRSNMPDCLYFDVDKLTDIDQLMAKVS